MVVFEDTVAHSLPAWDILAGFYVVRVVRDFSYKNHARLFIRRIIGNSVYASVEPFASGSAMVFSESPPPVSCRNLMDDLKS